MIFVSAGRLLQIGVLYGIVVFIFLFIGVKVLKRGKSITNRYLGTFYFWSGVTMSFNIIYVALDIPEFIAIMANLVAASMGFALVFLLLFVLIIRHSQAEITKKKQIIWITLAGVLQIVTMVIGTVGAGAGVGNTGAPANDNVPVWQWYYSLYCFVTNAFLIILTMYNAYKTRQGFSDNAMRNRFTYFLIAMALLFWIMGMNPWANMEATSLFRTFFALSALAILPAAALLYMSLGKEVQKKE